MPRQASKPEVIAASDITLPLESLSAIQLRAAWEDGFCCPPLQPFYRSLAIRLISFHQQEMATGGFDEGLRQQLAEYAPGGAKDAARRAAPRIKPGTRLSRT